MTSVFVAPYSKIKSLAAKSGFAKGELDYLQFNPGLDGNDPDDVAKDILDKLVAPPVLLEADTRVILRDAALTKRRIKSTGNILGLLRTSGKPENKKTKKSKEQYAHVPTIASFEAVTPSKAVAPFARSSTTSVTENRSHKQKTPIRRVISESKSGSSHRPKDGVSFGSHVGGKHIYSGHMSRVISDSTRRSSDTIKNGTVDLGLSRTLSYFSANAEYNVERPIKKEGNSLPMTSKLSSSKLGARSRTGSQIDEEKVIDKKSSSKSGKSSKSKSPKRPPRTTSRPKIDLVLRERVRKSSSGSLKMTKTNSSSRHARSFLHQQGRVSSHSGSSNAQWKSIAGQKTTRSSTSGTLLLSLYGNSNDPKSDGILKNAHWDTSSGSSVIGHSTGRQTSTEAAAKPSGRRSVSTTANAVNPPLRRTLSTTEALPAGMLSSRRTLTAIDIKRSTAENNNDRRSISNNGSRVKKIETLVEDIESDTTSTLKPAKRRRSSRTLRLSLHNDAHRDQLKSSLESQRHMEKQIVDTAVQLARMCSMSSCEANEEEQEIFMRANLLKEANDGFLSGLPEAVEEASSTPLQSQGIGACMVATTEKDDISKAAESQSLLGASHDQSESESIDKSIKTYGAIAKKHDEYNSHNVKESVNASSCSDDRSEIGTVSHKDDGDSITLSCSYNTCCVQEKEESKANKQIPIFEEKEQRPFVRRCSAFGDVPVVGPVTRLPRRRMKTTKPRNVEAEYYNDLDSSSEFSFEYDEDEIDPEEDDCSEVSGEVSAFEVPMALAQGATKAVVITEVNDSTKKMVESTTGSVRRSSSKLLQRVNSVSTALGAGVSQAFTKFSPPTPTAYAPVPSHTESVLVEEKNREIAGLKDQLLLQAKDKEIAELKAQLYEAHCKANSLIDANNHLSAQLEAYMLVDDGSDDSDPGTVSTAAAKTPFVAKAPQHRRIASLPEPIKLE